MEINLTLALKYIQLDRYEEYSFPARQHTPVSDFKCFLVLSRKKMATPHEGIILRSSLFVTTGSYGAYCCSPVYKPAVCNTAGS